MKKLLKGKFFFFICKNVKYKFCRIECCKVHQIVGLRYRYPDYPQFRQINQK